MALGGAVGRLLSNFNVLRRVGLDSRVVRLVSKPSKKAVAMGAVIGHSLKVNQQCVVAPIETNGLDL